MTSLMGLRGATRERYIVTRPLGPRESGPYKNNGNPAVPCGTFTDKSRAVGKAISVAADHGAASLRIVTETTFTFAHEAIQGKD